MQTFHVDELNQLTNVTRPAAAKMTVAGGTSSQASSVTVNTSNALLYADFTFVSTNHTLVNGTNEFTALATDSLGRSDSEITTVFLPESVVLTYDDNGNLLSDGRRHLQWDDENQLSQVIVTNATKSDFVYDGLGRRRTRTEAIWNGSAWVTTGVIRYVYHLALFTHGVVGQWSIPKKTGRDYVEQMTALRNHCFAFLPSPRRW